MNEEDQFVSVQDWYEYTYHVEGLITDPEHIKYLEQYDAISLAQMIEKDSYLEER